MTTSAEKLAKEILPKNAFDYYSSGSGDEITLRENERSFSRYDLIPRVLVDVSSINTSVSLFGKKLSSPILVAPMAFQKLASENGEIDTANACRETRTGMILSTFSTTSMEDVAQTLDAGPQERLYVYRDRRVTMDLIRRAEQIGVDAIIVTVDAPVIGLREKDDRNGFRLPSHLSLANIVAPKKTHNDDEKMTPRQHSSIDSNPINPNHFQNGDDNYDTNNNIHNINNQHVSQSGLVQLFTSEIDASLDWSVIPWLRSVTKLPIVLKGILSPLDAVRAKEMGIDGIIVSNHGGRQLDTAPSGISALANIMARLQALPASPDDRPFSVLVDGGVRRGSDVIKCLCLGAKAVLIGRPVLWALARDGAKSVAELLKKLQKELTTDMTLVGAPTLSHLVPEMIAPTARL